jgi:hypothetical protein
MLDLEIGALGVFQERLDKLANRLFSNTRLHRNIVIEAIISQITQDLVSIQPTPGLTEIRHKLLILCAHKDPPLPTSAH